MTTQPADAFVDIHCHLIPGIDDGSTSWDESLEMAELAVGDGIRTIIVTPHQLGAFVENDGETIRDLASELQNVLADENIQLEILPGGDVRIEPDMIDGLRSGSVLSLGDHRKHVLLELPHEIYFPLEPVLDELRRIGMTGILSHPERNEGLLRQPELIRPLVQHGCLMQVTGGSLVGTFGPRPKQMSEWLLREGLVHFLATDAHSAKTRRPLIRRAFERTIEITGEEIAVDLCCHNPSAVALGDDVEPRIRKPVAQKSKRWFSWARSG